MTTQNRDVHRSAVYRAEDQWSATLDRGGVVDFFGSVIDVPEQLRFGALEAVQTYVDDVVAHLEVPLVRVRHRRGGTRAHYSQGEIAIPTTHGWAMRESVVLHEVAHHVCVTDRSSGAHDRYFTATMLELADIRFGPGAALLLRTGYQAAGVPVEETV